MSLPTLTIHQANRLYVRGHAFVEGDYGLTTRTAFYQWVTPGCQTLTCPTPDHEGYYERTHEGLRVQHSLGVVWDTNAKRFRRCHCDYCARHPAQTAQGDLVD